MNEKLAQAVIDVAREVVLFGGGIPELRRAIEAYETQPVSASPALQPAAAPNDTVPAGLYKAACEDSERMANVIDDYAQIVQALQKALFYWMPKVFDERSAHDAYLLVGYEGEAEESYGEKIKDRADLYDHMLEVAKAAGFESITEAIASAAKSNAARDVLAERRRQIDTEGWTPGHDDLHDDCEMALAAIVYVESAVGYHVGCPDTWPWSPLWFKPTTPRRDLVKAGALIFAEIERLDRAQGANHAE